MKIGMLHSSSSSLLIDSLKHVFRYTERALSLNHELIYRSDEYWQSSASKKEELNTWLCQNCDVLLGSFDPDLLETRSKQQNHSAYVCLLLGSTCRGLAAMRNAWSHLTTNDVLVGTCTADVEICNRFFHNLSAATLPLAFDNSLFSPLDSRVAAKHSLGLSAEDKVVLYAGRITLEKNVHTVLKVFSMLQRRHPTLHLVLAGDVYNSPFFEFGIYPVDLKRWLLKLAAALEIKDSNLHVVGRKEPDELRTLYNAADVLLNMTLHHDENFGLAQVEAMACGTPVVGTHWGGLKDTILNAETGYTVSTFVTKAGVKVDWLAAARHVADLLKLSEDQESVFRQNCHRSAIARFDTSVYAGALEEIISSTYAKRDSQARSLELSEFGREYWDTCWQQVDGAGPAIYLRSERSFELYRELVDCYAGRSPLAEAPIAILELDDVVFATAHISENENGNFALDDPLFLVDVPFRTPHRDTVRAVLTVIAQAPWARIGDIVTLTQGYPDRVFEALNWLIDAGLLIRTSARTHDLTDLIIPQGVNRSLFAHQALHHTIDAVLLR